MTTIKEYTINKFILLNWLGTAEENLSFEDFGRWIEARTKGQYSLVKKKEK